MKLELELSKAQATLLRTALDIGANKLCDTISLTEGEELKGLLSDVNDNLREGV